MVRLTSYRVGSRSTRSRAWANSIRSLHVRRGVAAPDLRRARSRACAAKSRSCSRCCSSAQRGHRQRGAAGSASGLTGSSKPATSRSRSTCCARRSPWIRRSPSTTSRGAGYRLRARTPARIRFRFRFRSGRRPARTAARLLALCDGHGRRGFVLLLSGGASLERPAARRVDASARSAPTRSGRYFFERRGAENLVRAQSSFCAGRQGRAG